MKTKTYRQDFHRYLSDTAKKIPHPGGGSCAALVFCTGISLIEMAAAYSGVLNDRTQIFFEDLKTKVFPMIDEDGELFSKVMEEKDRRKKRALLVRVQQCTYDVGHCCERARSRACRIAPEIKSALKSDFLFGLKLLESALYVSCQNLEANQKMFSVDNTKKIGRLNEYRKKFRTCLK